MLGDKGRSAHVRIAIALLGIAAIPGLWAGCGVSAAGLCDKTCECVGCSASEREECIDEIEDEEKLASAKGCSAEYDAVFGCFDEQLRCVDGELDVDGCDTEQNALSKCLGDGTSNECPFTNDGVCDEPDSCPPGTDFNDCNGGCAFTNDGVCDEPDDCAPGTDFNDCNGGCAFTNDGVCDEPDQCAPGTDFNDCNGGCPFTNDGVCDEPNRCPPGTDFNDCNGPSVDCDCACGSGSPTALVCNDPAHPSFCAGVQPVAGGMCETALIQNCGFTFQDISELGCTP